MAKLYFRYGAMNSGKSTALLQAAFNYEERGHRVLLAKPAIDTKGEHTIVSRLGFGRAVDFVIEPDASVRALFAAQVAAGAAAAPVSRVGAGDSPVPADDAGAAAPSSRAATTPSCLLVDEAQFLTATQVDDLFRIAVQDNVPVIAYGIRTDFQTAAFPGSRRLLEVAHSLEELKTICRCGRKAIFNGRLVDGRFIFDGDQVAIDGAEVTYESLCGSCYLTESGGALGR
ncbi:MAG TPA: thymidine kinase [Candidatus Lumbricidophila sp.]|nr:thymidine kinase [Candidatus Lumbricidophila sp.]